MNQEKTMPLTENELQRLEDISHDCDGKPKKYFEERYLPTLAGLSHGELWALSGMFLFREMPLAAKTIAAYARVALEAWMANGPPPDPHEWLAQWVPVRRILDDVEPPSYHCRRGVAEATAAPDGSAA